MDLQTHPHADHPESDGVQSVGSASSDLCLVPLIGSTLGQGTAPPEGTIRELADEQLTVSSSRVLSSDPRSPRTTP